MSVEILLDHQDFIAIDKKENISAHNDENSVLSLFKEKMYLPHRLDRETSGVLMLAKSSQACMQLIQSLNSATKTYTAVLRGSLPKSQDWQVWDYSISDKAEGYKNPAGLAKDRLIAKSRYRVLQSNAYFSMLEVQIDTGRQHQIRKHSALFSKPIVGDMRYGNNKDNASLFKRYQFERMLLHASRIQFQYNQQDYDIQSPLPELFQKVFV